MHSSKSILSRWTSLLARTGFVVGAGGLALLGVGATAAPQTSATLQLSLRPNHFAAHSLTAARGKTAAPAATSPCWASSNWSGYAVATTSSLSCQPSSGVTYTSVSGQWTVPAVSASSGASYSAAWLGIDGFNNDTLIQTGTEQDYYSRSAHYSAWWTTSAQNFEEQPISEPVKPGDVITATISEVNPSTELWDITLADSSESPTWSFTTQQTYTGVGASAEWIMEAPGVNGRVATLAHYGSTTFNLDSVNGTSPSLVAGDGGELVQGNFFRSQVVSIPSAPVASDEFAIAYGSTAPAVP
jgi:Peptidase A4 family